VDAITNRSRKSEKDLFFSVSPRRSFSPSKNRSVSLVAVLGA